MSRVSLIIEGGGMRGLFSAGVLDFFIQRNLYFNNVYGVSAGACHGLSYISKQFDRARRVNINYVKIGLGGGNMILAQENGRVMPKEDKIFALNGRAKKMIEEKGKDAVINATIGALLNDNGDLAVMQSVVDEIRSLKGADYAEYAPIGGIPAFKEAMVKAVFHDYSPRRFVEMVATPGGTGGIRNTVSNYSKPGDRIITCDWYWSPYSTICTEQGRTLDTYELFDEHGVLFVCNSCVGIGFNGVSFFLQKFHYRRDPYI